MIALGVVHQVSDCASLLGFFFCMWYAAKKHWLATMFWELLSVFSIEMLSLGSFITGVILCMVYLLHLPCILMSQEVSRTVTSIVYFWDRFDGYYHCNELPALLYVVPSVIGLLLCTFCGMENVQLLDFDELIAEVEEVGEEDDASKPNKMED
ncbi:hypothetical protein ACP70R_029485 [Stipagrostis hirtigluma subsp. patula]